MINLVIDILKANTTLTNLVSADNIYPLIQLQGGNIPAVVVQLTGTAPNDTQDSVSTYDDNQVVITCIAISPAAAWAMSEAVRAAVDGYTGGSIAQIRFQTQGTDVFESTEVFSVTQNYSVHLKRDAGTLPIAIAGLGEFNLNDIADVDTTGVTDGQVISYDDATSTWVASDAAATLVDLTDTTIDDPIDRQVLAYDEATGEWINDGAGSISIPVFNETNDEIERGRPLTATGSQGDRIAVSPYSNIYEELRFVGIAGETIPARSNGHATVYGEIRMLDTSNFEVGDFLYPVTGTNPTFYPYGLFKWTDANDSPLVCAIVTRKQQNTGRIFIRMWSPGYRNELRRMSDVQISAEFEGALLKYDSSIQKWAVPPQTSKLILEDATETVEIYYYSKTTDTQQYRDPQSDTPSAGNVIRRKIWYSVTAQDDIDSGTWILLQELDDDATYAQLVTAFESQLNTSPAGDTPVSIKTTWEEAPAFTGLLDTYPGAAAAYSLRLLDTDYTGDAIRVRRASDNTEQDIGFDGNGDLDASALATFCAGTDGFVKVWYDQSGNSNDATQTTTASQPKVYDSVTGVVLENGKAVVDGTSDSYFAIQLSSPISDVFMAFTVANAVSRVGQYDYLVGNNDSVNGNWFFGYDDTALWSLSPDFASIIVPAGIWYKQSLATYLFDAGTGNFYIDGNSVGSNSPGSNALGDSILLLSATAGSRFWNGNLQEFILYPSDQSANRTGIETNINDHYSIYTP